MWKKKKKKERLFQIGTFLAGLFVRVFCQRAKSISCFYTQEGQRKDGERKRGQGWENDKNTRMVAVVIRSVRDIFVSLRSLRKVFNGPPRVA